MVFRKKNQYSIFSIYSGRMKATPTLVLGRPECFADEGRFNHDFKMHSFSGKEFSS